MFKIKNYKIGIRNLIEQTKIKFLPIEAKSPLRNSTGENKKTCSSKWLKTVTFVEKWIVGRHHLWVIV